jgi:N-acetylmuramoyl-L-alanine amidase
LRDTLIRILLLLIPLTLLCMTGVGSVAQMVEETELECLSLNIYHEARNESTAGQVAVGQVTLNRVESSRFPDSVCGVVQQGIYRGGYPVRDRCQFSWFCDGLSDNPYDLPAYNRSVEIAQWLLFTNPWLPDFTDGSLFYHAEYVLPKWSRVKKKTMRIDTHIFYQ